MAAKKPEDVYTPNSVHYGIMMAKLLGRRVVRLFSGIKRSITAKILLIVLLCWGLPVLAIGGYSILFYSNSINSRINDYLQNQFYYYNQFAVERLNTCVEQSKKTTYDMTIENAYSRYAGGAIPWEVFYMEADGYNRNRFYLNSRYLLSAFFLVESPEAINFTSRNGMVDIDYYNEFVRSRVTNLAEGLDTDVGFIVHEGRLYLVRNLMRVIGPQQRFGVLVLQIDPEYLFGHMHPESDDGLKAIRISLGDVIYPITAARYAQADVPNADRAADVLLDTMGSAVSADADEIIFYNRIRTDDYTFGSAMVVDKATVYARYQNLRNIIYIIWLLLPPLAILVVYFLHRNVARPIRSLVNATSQIQRGSFGVSIDTAALRNVEFKTLAESFNAMSAELKRLFEVAYKEELALKDAKILALQAQINPHFLNNTLEMMNWQARMAGDNDVSLMIEALSTLLDAGMDRSDRRLIPLREELISCDAYLYIIGKRFGERITITQQIDEALLEQPVPRLILQPLLENSVIHGVELVPTGEIMIRVFAADDRHMAIQIINSGQSLTRESILRIRRLLEGEVPAPGQPGRLGIRNVNERIRLIYGPQYGLRIYRDENGRTVSEIRIPVDHQKTEHDNNGQLISSTSIPPDSPAAYTGDGQLRNQE